MKRFCKHLHDVWECGRNKQGTCRDCERERQHRRNLKKLYGITMDIYDALNSAQGGCCAVCGKQSDGRRLDIDHDHTTGKVRGLLCAACNRAIGLIHDSSERAWALASYLEEHGR